MPSGSVCWRYAPAGDCASAMRLRRRSSDTGKRRSWPNLGEIKLDFTCGWTSGEAPFPAPAWSLWGSPGSGDGTDALHLFAFAWRDPPPEGNACERLVKEVASVIDAWIARRL
jgi:hypothetical protein